uniref:Putative secreted protein n=1 Tax=Xenopsylla cheopis TaxID=163159 RepID=A0A6M2DWH6_XENCH
MVILTWVTQATNTQIVAGLVILAYQVRMDIEDCKKQVICEFLQERSHHKGNVDNRILVTECFRKVPVQIIYLHLNMSL